MVSYQNHRANLANACNYDTVEPPGALDEPPREKSEPP